MAKRRPLPKISDHTLSPTYGDKLLADETRRASVQHDQAQKHRRISYIPGVKLEQEPAQLPRLFVRGMGGSIKMDLSGLGIPLSPSAFAFEMPDESLQNLGIHRGDLAIVDLPQRSLREGDLIMVTSGPAETLRAVTKRDKIWYLHAAAGKGVTLIPLWKHAYTGIVLGFVRLFEPLKPAKYRAVIPDSDLPRERTLAECQSGQPASKPKANLTLPSQRYRTRKRRSSVLVAEPAGRLRLSELDGESGHAA